MDSSLISIFYKNNTQRKVKSSLRWNTQRMTISIYIFLLSGLNRARIPFVNGAGVAEILPERG